MASVSPTKISSYLFQHPNQTLILDGALATYLETLGADISSSLWSASILISQPDLIHKTHLDYYRELCILPKPHDTNTNFPTGAGANIAITASYQASIPGLTAHLGLTSSQAAAIVRTCVQLAQTARSSFLASQPPSSIPEPLFIAGSVGPYGAFLANGSEYTGSYSLPVNEMKDFHRGRIQALVDARVDLLACETIPSKGETEALLELLRDEFPDTEAWFTFTLRDAEHIADGTSLAEIAELFKGVEKVVGLGFNCVPDGLALSALENLQPLTQKVLVVYPNSGEQWNARAREWEGSRTEGSTLAQKTVQWRDAGAGMVGGCCRTTPDDIKTMRDALRESG